MYMNKFNNFFHSCLNFSTVTDKQTNGFAEAQVFISSGKMK
jgi:hypothetical protein